MEYEERISSLEERLRHYHHSPKPEGRLTESTTATTQTPSTQTISLATPMATVKPTTSVKYSSSTRVSATPTASIKPLAATTQTPRAAVTPTLISASNNSSTQQQASVASVAPVTTVTTVSVTAAMDMATTSVPISSAAMVTSGEVPTTTTSIVEVPVVTTATTVSVVEPTTSLITSGETSTASHDLQEPQESRPTSQEASLATSVVQPDAQLTVQLPVALKHTKLSTTSVPTVNIVRMKHPGLSSMGAHHGRVIKRHRPEEDGSTDREGSVDSKKIKREVAVTDVRKFTHIIYLVQYGKATVCCVWFEHTTGF